jgi:hypothetical protein
MKAVREFQMPRNVHEVQRFLALTSYYQRFIREFARVVAPLHHLTKKDTQWLWTHKCEAAFNRLKDLLTTAPYQKSDQRYADTSIYGLCVVLSQEQPDAQLHNSCCLCKTSTLSDRAELQIRHSCSDILYGSSFLCIYRPYLCPSRTGSRPTPPLSKTGGGQEFMGVV